MSWRLVGPAYLRQFGMAFDPKSGNLWEEENGYDSFTDINRVEPGMNVE